MHALSVQHWCDRQRGENRDSCSGDTSASGEHCAHRQQQRPAFARGKIAPEAEIAPDRQQRGRRHPDSQQRGRGMIMEGM